MIMSLVRKIETQNEILLMVVNPCLLLISMISCDQA
jgi:hypothetical protein